jgi:hypothetical protein
MRTIKMLLISTAMLASAGAVMAKDITCADYHRHDVYARFCRSNTDRVGLLGCCTETAEWKAACDVFQVFAMNHVAASMLANSSRAGRRAMAKAFKDCTARKPENEPAGHRSPGHAPPASSAPR